jgi:hypothetical protein
MSSLRVRAKLCSSDIKVGLWPKACVQLFAVFPVAKRALYARFGERHIEVMANTLCDPDFTTAFLDELGDTTWQQLCDALVVVGFGTRFLAPTEEELKAGVLTNTHVVWPPPADYKLPKLTIDQ